MAGRLAKEWQTGIQVSPLCLSNFSLDLPRPQWKELTHLVQVLPQHELHLAAVFRDDPPKLWGHPV
jgi:hypothetical protein